MTVPRREVFERLAATSDADGERTTRVEALATALDADAERVAAHVDGLVACELARVRPDGRVRVTVTGEELLELAADVDDGSVIVAPPTDSDG